MKYPRTPHLPWSPGGTSDDRHMSLADVAALAASDVVVTEKLDGSNICLTRDAVFARSHSGPPSHPSFGPLKGLWAQLRYALDPAVEVFCEWTWAVHSIAYDALPTALWVIGVRVDPMWLDWRTTETFAANLGLQTVPVLRVGAIDNFEAVTTDLGRAPGLFGTREGVVVRRLDGFDDADFSRSVAKWVRADHVQTDEHWSHGAFVKQNIVA